MSSFCRMVALGLVATLLYAVAGTLGAQYSSNMFLNGEYKNGLASHPDADFRSNPPAAAFISMLSKRASPFVGQGYLPTLLECTGRQQCVPKAKCKNGYFTEKLPKVQKCAPEENVCCTYNPPVTTTETPYTTCSSNMACVSPRDCRNGEILANAVVNVESKKCLAPKLCCSVPSTMLTNDGYVLKTPPTPLVYPTPQPIRTTTPVNNMYLPPVTARNPTNGPVRQSEPTESKYNAGQSQQRPQAPVPATRRPQGGIVDHKEESSNQENIVMRGEDQLSPQIFPSNNNRRPGKIVSAEQSPVSTFPVTPSKCASALLCTEENFCSAIGVISETPVEITPFRVPLTDCIIEATGAPGKCCRDPNYVDPWPIILGGVCAQRNKNTKPKGVKDIDTDFAEIPWQAMILKESSKSLLCGGAIIGDGVILTTASCVQGVSVSDLRVKAGEWQLGSTDEPLPFQLVGVDSVAVHPNYDPSSGSNNMAVLHLSKRLEFKTHIMPICISDKDPSPSETCVTTGWGKQALSIHEEGAIMHVTTTTPVARSDCGADNSSVCSTTTFDSCEFDSGSALACGTGTGVLLKGIYSVENACGEGQTVRFIKPDVEWVNKQFTERKRELPLRLF